MDTKIAWAIFAVALISGIAVAAVVVSINMQGQGNINSTPGIQASVSTIDWGSVAPGQTYTKTFTVANVGNQPVTISFSTPNVPTGLTVTYTMTNYNLTPQQVGTVTATLTVASDAPAGAFSYTTTVTGTTT